MDVHINLCDCRDNFKITFSSTEADQTVFKILEDACIELMKLSFELKSQDGSHAKHWDVYHRMLWSECVVMTT